jgi:hypothetical protein
METVEPGANVKRETRTQRAKQDFEMVLTEDGIQID